MLGNAHVCGIRKAFMVSTLAYHSIYFFLLADLKNTVPKDQNPLAVLGAFKFFALSLSLLHSSAIRGSSFEETHHVCAEITMIINC